MNMMNELYLARTELRPVGPDRWREFEIWSRPGNPTPDPRLNQERLGKFFRPLAPGEDVEALRAAGKICMIADGFTNQWVVEE